METSRPTAVATKQLENERVIVTEWRFQPGAETGWHKHGYDYLVVPGMDGKLILETEQGDNTAELKAGLSYFKSAGVEHNVVNPNIFEFYFVEIELL